MLIVTKCNHRLSVFNNFEFLLLKIKESTISSVENIMHDLILKMLKIIKSSDEQLCESARRKKRHCIFSTLDHVNTGSCVPMWQQTEFRRSKLKIFLRLMK